MQRTTQIKYLSDKILADRYQVTRNTIWRWVRDGKLPKPHKLSGGTTRWLLHEIESVERGWA